MKTYLLGQPGLDDWYRYIWQPEDVPSVPLTESAESTIVEPCLMCGEKVSAVWGRKDAVCLRCGLKKECC